MSVVLSQDVLCEGRSLLVPDEYGTVSFTALAVFFHKHGAALLDLANVYEFDVNVPLADLREENARLRAALETIARPDEVEFPAVNWQEVVAREALR